MHWIPGAPRDSASFGVRFFGGGGSSGSTTTTQNSQPWGPQQPLVEEGFAGAQNLYQNYKPTYFPSNTVAQFNPTQIAGQNAETNLGINGTPAVTSSGNYLTSLENGSYFANPSSATLSPFWSGEMLSGGNPYFKSMANQVTASVLPSLTGTFNMGNSINNPNAGYSVSNGLTDAIGGIANQDYENQSGNMLQASEALGNNWNQGVNEMTQGSIFAPGIQTADFQDAAAIEDAGAQQQQESQANINDAVNRWNFSTQLPYNILGTFQNMINGNYGGTSTTTQPYFSNNSGMGGLIGAGLGLAASYLTGGAALPFMMGGGMMGSSIFSDPRLKDIGDDYEGALDLLDRLPVKKARYKFDRPGTERAMVMAPDVQRLVPGAVRGDPGGSFFQMVDTAQVVPLLIAGIKELHGEIDELRQRRAA